MPPSCCSGVENGEKHRMPDMDAATLWLYVDNQERQRGNTSQMMHSIPELVSEVSKYWRLTAGDLIYTGTPVFDT